MQEHQSEQELHDQLNAGTGKIEWTELERHFARGVVVKVDPALDLVEVAACMVRDDTESLRTWMSDGSVAKATEDDARAWGERQPLFWAVVTAPWVLIQEIEHPDN
ncbi:MAG: DUF2288 domain-containing protein [Gammaproteobacteria bacterium]